MISVCARRRRRAIAARPLSRAQAQDCDGGILHRRAGRGHAHRHSGIVRRRRSWLRHLQQCRQADHARRAAGAARAVWRREPGNRRGHGTRRAGPCAGSPRGCRHRHRRTGWRRARQAGRPCALRRLLAHAADRASGAPVRRHRTHSGARSFRRRWRSPCCMNWPRRNSEQEEAASPSLGQFPYSKSTRMDFARTAQSRETCR